MSSVVIRPSTPVMNPWESKALKFGFSDESGDADDNQQTVRQWQSFEDPAIYPGIYSGTGFDLMKVLLWVFSRPNPQISLGPMDCSVSLTVCDLNQADSPIIYASDSFCELTGYSTTEIIGRNCRFLQSPPSLTPVSAKVQDQNRAAIARMRAAIASKSEVQLQLFNFKKNGQQFINMLSIIPICDSDPNTNLAIGFQAEYQ